MGSGDTQPRPHAQRVRVRQAERSTAISSLSAPPSATVVLQRSDFASPATGCSSTNFPVVVTVMKCSASDQGDRSVAKAPRVHAVDQAAVLHFTIRGRPAPIDEVCGGGGSSVGEDRVADARPPAPERRREACSRYRSARVRVWRCAGSRSGCRPHRRNRPGTSRRRRRVSSREHRGAVSAANQVR